jgi:hypothetical protein
MPDFEIQDFVKLNLGPIGTGTLEGQITGLSVLEDDGSGGFAENTVIRTDRKWKIELKWELVGTMLNLPASGFLTIPGIWVVKGYLEGWGEDALDKDLQGDKTGGISVMNDKKVENRPAVPATPTIPAQPAATAWLYTETVSIAAGTIAEGPYKLAVTVTYENPAGTPGPMAGFVEFKNMIQIYKPS